MKSKATRFLLFCLPISIVMHCPVCSFAQNVGIGTLSPDYRLHIYNTGPSLLKLENSTALATDVTNDLFLKTGSYYTGGVKTIGTGFNVARLGFFTYASQAESGLLERLSILDNGNTGIGTINPLVRLHISVPGTGLLLLDNTQTLGIDMADNFYFRTGSWFTGGIKTIGQSTFEARLGFFTFASANSADLLERLSITDNGNVGIGTTAPDRKLKVLSSSTASGQGVIHGEFTGTGVVDAYGVYGKSTPQDGYGYGGVFEGGHSGVLGYVSATGFSNYHGIRGIVDGDAAVGSFKAGVYGYATGNGTINVGVYGTVVALATSNYAGYFNGYLYAISASSTIKSFRIDHPLDPLHKYLYHSSVESPDMKNIYDGIVITDANGEALITLPEYFDALNKDYRYQLTTIGLQAQTWVVREIQNNSFTIKTDKPNVKVSWQVTGIRKDPAADLYRIIPEVSKKEGEDGKYQVPEAYGRPASMGIGYIDHKK